MGELPLHFACRALSEVRDVSPREAGGAMVPILCPDALMGTLVCSAFALNQLSILYNSKTTQTLLHT